MGSLTATEICGLFNQCFALPQPDACTMWRGGDEPLYEPAHAGQSQAHIYYARDLAQSCLHEAAHWLYAGARRRLLTDYGYWYVPDGRDAGAQLLFEQHEAAIQAREWILSTAARSTFRISTDNLSSAEPSPAFVDSLIATTHELLQARWNRRMLLLFRALCSYTQQTAVSVLQPQLYTKEFLLMSESKSHSGCVHE